MAGVAFDGSPWVTGVQASGVGEPVAPCTSEASLRRLRTC